VLAIQFCRFKRLLVTLPLDSPQTPRDKPAQNDEPARPVASDVRPAGGGMVSWIVLLTITAAALAIAFAHFPPTFKKLGLLAVAYGVLVGGAGVWLAPSTARVRLRPWLWTFLVVILAVAGQIGIAVESFRLTRAEEQRLERANPNQLLARRLLESVQEPPDAKSQASLDEFRRTHVRAGDSFGDYLEFRVSNLGIRSKWGAELFWAAEVVLGGLAAGWIFFRRSGAKSFCPSAAGGCV
jgi:hypothetical protein